ncbi:hypothetical protein D9M71_714120 [compost metagenome]
MGDLRAGCATVAVHRIGEHAQVGDGVAVEGDLVGEGAAVAAHRTVGDRGQRGAAGGHCLVKAHQLSRGRAALGHALVGGGLDEAVLQRQRADLQRAEGRGCIGQVLVVVHAESQRIDCSWKAWQGLLAGSMPAVAFGGRDPAESR